MASIDLANQIIEAKIVYFGPGLGGKTTNLRVIRDKFGPQVRRDLESIETETERTLYFDVLTLQIPEIAGFTLRFRLYTVPGQDHYESTRTVVLKGADGVVFVADAQTERLDANKTSLRELEQSMQLLDLSPAMVLQYNKVDLRQTLPATELDLALNPAMHPRFEAAALHDRGVFETLQAICRLVTQRL